MKTKTLIQGILFLSLLWLQPMTANAGFGDWVKSKITKKEEKPVKKQDLKKFSPNQQKIQPMKSPMLTDQLKERRLVNMEQILESLEALNNEEDEGGGSSISATASPNAYSVMPFLSCNNCGDSVYSYSCVEREGQIRFRLYATPCDDTIIVHPDRGAIESSGIHCEGNGVEVYLETICPNATKVFVDAKAGNDTVSASEVDIYVKLVGGTGNDRLIGGTEENVLLGGIGHDKLRNHASMATLSGNSGDDCIDSIPFTIHGERNFIFAGSGHDTVITGGGGYVSGGSGNDLIRVVYYGTVMDGGAGNDVLFGSMGADDIYGGAGDDLLVGGPDGSVVAYSEAGSVENRFDGGAGADIYVFNNEEGGGGSIGQDSVIGSDTGERHDFEECLGENGICEQLCLEMVTPNTRSEVYCLWAVGSSGIPLCF